MNHRLATRSLILTGLALTLLGAEILAQGSINLNNFSTLTTGNIPGRSARADLDGDGDLDLVVPNVFDNTVTVWRNDGGLAFTPIQTLNTAVNVSDVDLVDMNGDTFLDILLTARTATVQVFANNGSASFAPPLQAAAGFDSYSALPIDLDGDTDLDLLVCNYAPDKISILLNDGSGNLTLVGANFAGGGGPSEIIAVDLDKDNDKDLVISLADSNVVLIVENTGIGYAPLTFHNTGIFPLDMIVRDFNQDGFPDIVTANTFSNDITFIRNTGNLTFAASQHYGVGDRPTALAAADIDNALGLDIVVATFDGGGVSVLPNNGLSAFAMNVVQFTGGNAFDILVGDFDGDYDDDLLSINLSGNRIDVIENQLPARRYPGTDEDLNLVSIIDGITVPANQAVTVGHEGSVVTNTLISLMGTFDNEVGIIAIQQFNPGFPPFTMTPGLYLNNFVYPAQLLLQQVLVPGGITVQLNVPVGTVGQRYLVQGFAVTPTAMNGLGAFTDAIEFRVIP